ncbi:hypothetical protein RF11_09118 [Thelohanellus kitauei]|uniref:Uncharacterized protein n=1 Tax=Thelohanellus kitauei TaxID=669202 RepID=A0A0C2NAK0_THEKT|nr:hypothetical protein RF11_09118 [Thelohanellus kitauei]
MVVQTLQSTVYKMILLNGSATNPNPLTRVSQHVDSFTDSQRSRLLSIKINEKTFFLESILEHLLRFLDPELEDKAQNTTVCDENRNGIRLKTPQNLVLKHVSYKKVT